MTEVYLIRHSIKMRGPVKGDFGVYDRMQPLSGEGEERAKQLLELPELRGAGFAAASTMSRSLATIRYLLEVDDVPFAIDDRLRELDFGIKPEGMPMDDFMGRRWEHPEEVPQGGESVVQCRARMDAAIREVVREHPDASCAWYRPLFHCTCGYYSVKNSVHIWGSDGLLYSPSMRCFYCHRKMWEVEEVTSAFPCPKCGTVMEETDFVCWD